jgi:hypothetical protein
MMQKGLINRISIEADNPLQEEIDGKVIIKGFDLMGAGFVKYAGIPQASASIAEAIENIEKHEKTEFEVEQMAENADLDAKLAKIEAFEAAEKKRAVEEAEKAKLAEEAKVKTLEESVLALQSEMKSMKETKSGIITGTESTVPSPKFLFEGQKTDKAMFYPENPSEFY